MRVHYERRLDVASMRAGMFDIIDFSQRIARRRIDQRICRAVDEMQARAANALSVTQAAASSRLSASRFQHLFTREVGVPFRRYRTWHRLRAAIREVTQGSNLTAAAHMAGFADQAHFTRELRRTFGAPPSRGFIVQG